MTNNKMLGLKRVDFAINAWVETYDDKYDSCMHGDHIGHASMWQWRAPEDSSHIYIARQN